MIRIKRILTKCLAAVLGFVILPCIFAFGASYAEAVPESEKEPIYSPEALPQVSPREPDEYIHASIASDCIGKVYKISDLGQITVSASVSDEIESPENNVFVSFIPSNRDHHLSMRYIANSYDATPETVYIGCWEDGERVLKEFAEGVYTQEWLTFYFENGSDDYTRFYNEGCHLKAQVDIRALAALDSVETGSIAIRGCIDENFFYGNVDYRFGASCIFYASDGEYVAFSDVSNEDAIFILTGELPSDEPSVEDPPAEDPPAEEPRGFWATFIDLFNGCD